MNIADRDPWLEPYRSVLYRRDRYFHDTLEGLEGGVLGAISQGHKYFGFNRSDGIWFREWAPRAHAVFLVGDFNGWDRQATPLEKDLWGVWSAKLHEIPHESRVMLHVHSDIGAMDRIPAYAKRVVQDPETTAFSAVYWDPPEPYQFKNQPQQLATREGLRIYEAHVGMAVEDGRVGTYREFAADVLPRIKRLGYNAVQLMAIQEHPYYASFGYHVSSFFAPSSRYGTPDDLKELVDTAHGLGLMVLLDIVHSHAIKNTHEGLALMDGTDHQYFHAGSKGVHPVWDSLLFDYSKYEVLRFLLSNVRYWIDEFQFDGFRFDGVTSMLYKDHGIGTGFDNYDAYFGPNVDDEPLTYLRLMNRLAHELRPGVVTVAEDVSGFPGIARPTEESGVGFDYRLAMGLPDFWFKTIETQADEDWSLSGIFSTMLNRRRDEKHLAYVESHDQALVGDKTLAFWLMDKEMYTSMDDASQNLIIDRGVALHKMIRLITFSLGGEGYLNFMGNEFAHPEWIDFPREGNGNSYHYARRQWSLVDNGYLRYQKLERFDQAMLALDHNYGILTDELIEQLAVHEDTRQLIYRHGPLVFCANFHPHESFSGLQIPVPDLSDYRVVLDTDATEFGGFGRLDPGVSYMVKPWEMYGRQQSIEIYLPSRSIQVLAPCS